MLDKNISGRVRFGTIVSLFIALLLLIPSSTILVEAGDTIIVDDDGTGDYITIQAAINNAGVGDNIVVKDGTYAEQLTVNVPSISIVAASGETPVIYVSSYTVGIDVTAPDVHIEGFEIFGNSSLGSALYPAIRASSGSSGLNVFDNEFRVFTGQRGNLALLVADTVTQISFSYNYVTSYERGVSLNGNSWLDLQANQFFDVTSEVHHAAKVSGAPPNRVFGSITYAMEQAVNWNTVEVYNGTYLEDFVINKSIILEGSSDSVIVVSNKGSFPGATPGIDIQASNVELTGFTIKGPTLTGSEFCALVQVRNKSVIIHDNTFDVPRGAVGGIAIQTLYTSDISGLLIDNNVIMGNTSQSGDANGIYVNYEPGYGADDLTIRDNSMTDMWMGIACEQSNATLNGNTIIADDLSNAYGVAIWDDAANEQFNVNLNNNIVTGFDRGIEIGTMGQNIYNITVKSGTISGGNTGVLVRSGVNITVSDQDISDNAIYCLNNLVITSTVDATNNWWGNISGPYHPLANPTGTGGNVSDNATFWPWYEFNAYGIEPNVIYDVGIPKSEGGLYVTGDTPISIDASDDESGMRNLTYRVWNTTYRWSDWHDYVYPFKLYGEGKHMVEYNATDNAGTKNSARKIHFVDNYGPWIELLEPNGGEYIRGSLAIRWDSADQIRDQMQEQWNGFLPLSGDYPGHIQSFESTDDALNVVDLLLHGDEAEVTVIIFSEIFPVPIPVGQITRTLTDVGSEGYPQWVTFTLESEISLEVGKIYYLGVTQDIIGNTGFSWHYYNSTGGSDSYNYGQGWVKKIDALESRPDWDWAFRTSKWNTGDVDITIQYANSIPPIWSTISEGEDNDGEFILDTSSYPDSPAYKIRILATDPIGNINSDESDGPFTVDNTGPSVYNVLITDTTIGSTEYTKDGDRLEITATILGDIYNVTADLSVFGKDSSVGPNSLYQNTATWIVTSINCAPADGEITVSVTAYDPTGDFAQNTGHIIADNAPPMLEFTRPLPGIYVLDGQRLLPYPYPVIIGQITIKADANDVGAGIEKVEIYIDDRLRPTLTEEPYDYIWDEASIGFFKINAIAYDNVGFNATAVINDVFILNFDIFG